jgi:hypothetical protein
VSCWFTGPTAILGPILPVRPLFEGKGVPLAAWHLGKTLLEAIMRNGGSVYLAGVFVAERQESTTYGHTIRRSAMKTNHCFLTSLDRAIITSRATVSFTEL